MKKGLLFLLLLTQIAFGQINTGTTKSGKYQMNIPDLGSKKDSAVVWDGISKLLKYVPISSISSVTNLDYLATPTGGTVFSSSGNDALVPLATIVNAGLFSPEEKVKLEGITVTPDATTSEKGKLKLAGDLGGTADSPTTPTAIHKTGDETKAGVLTTYGNKITDNTYTYSETLLPIRNQFSAFFNQPFYQSDQGYYVFKPLGTNISSRFYIMPNGTVTGNTSKFEMFNTDYAANYTTYSGFNILLNNTSNEINIGPNRGVSGGSRMKMIIGGDYTGSQLLGSSSQLSFNTDNTVNLNPFGGSFSFGTTSVDPFSISLPNQVTLKNPVPLEPMRLNIVGNGWAAGMYLGRDNVRTASIATQATLSDLEISTNRTNAGNSLTANMRFFSSTGNVKIQDGGTFTDNGNRLQVNGTITADPAVNANQVVIKSQVDVLDSQNVKITGGQTISGYKTFNGGVNINTGTFGLDATANLGAAALLYFSADATPSQGNNVTIRRRSGKLSFCSSLTTSRELMFDTSVMTVNRTAIWPNKDGIVAYLDDIPVVLSGSAVLDFPNTAAGNTSDLTITVTGAALSDSVALGVANASMLAGIQFTAWVSAANTVTVRCGNLDLSTAKDPASGQFKVKILK